MSIHWVDAPTAGELACNGKTHSRPLILSVLALLYGHLACISRAVSYYKLSVL